MLIFGVVATSDDPKSRPGRGDPIAIHDGDRGAPDRIVLAGTDNGCDRSDEWTSTDPQRVNVNITSPHEAG